MSNKIVEEGKMTIYKKKKDGARVGRLEETPGGIYFYKKKCTTPHMKLTVEKLLLLFEAIGDFQKEQKVSSVKFNLLERLLKIVECKSKKNDKLVFYKIMMRLSKLKPPDAYVRLRRIERK